MAIFTGAATALITPFTEDLKVNYNKIEELVDYQIDNGIDAFKPETVVYMTLHKVAGLGANMPLNLFFFTITLR